jgi:glycogen debranching enzyme
MEAGARRADGGCAFATAVSTAIPPWTTVRTLGHAATRILFRSTCERRDPRDTVLRNGYLAYDSISKSGLINQGWKDSGDAIVNDEGQIAKPPIALVEVQAYVYLAKSGLADLLERAGEAETAARLRREAADLKQRFERDF